MMRIIVTVGIAAAVHALAGEKLVDLGHQVRDKLGFEGLSIQAKAVRGIFEAGIPAVVGAIVASRLA